MKYWLIKSEPSDYSIDDLKRDKVEHWDGVRNYQARNFMRDDMKVGDLILFYHSSSKPPHIAGIAKVDSKPYDDPTQFDPKDKHYDPKSSKNNPTWQLVDVRFVSKAKNPLSLDDIKNDSILKDMRLLQRGNRLSVFPIEKKEFEHIKNLIS